MDSHKADIRLFVIPTTASCSVFSADVLQASGLMTYPDDLAKLPAALESAQQALKAATKAGQAEEEIADLQAHVNVLQNQSDFYGTGTWFEAWLNSATGGAVRKIEAHCRTERGYDVSLEPAARCAVMVARWNHPSPPSLTAYDDMPAPLVAVLDRLILEMMYPDPRRDPRFASVLQAKQNMVESA